MAKSINKQTVVAFAVGGIVIGGVTYYIINNNFERQKVKIAFTPTLNEIMSLPGRELADEDTISKIFVMAKLGGIPVDYIKKYRAKDEAKYKAAINSFVNYPIDNFENYLIDLYQDYSKNNQEKLQKEQEILRKNIKPVSKDTITIGK